MEFEFEWCDMWDLFNVFWIRLLGLNTRDSLCLKKVEKMIESIHS